MIPKSKLATTSWRAVFFVSALRTTNKKTMHFDGTIDDDNVTPLNDAVVDENLWDMPMEDLMEEEEALTNGISSTNNNDENDTVAMNAGTGLDGSVSSSSSSSRGCGDGSCFWICGSGQQPQGQVPMVFGGETSSTQWERRKPQQQCGNGISFLNRRQPRQQQQQQQQATQLGSVEHDDYTTQLAKDMTSLSVKERDDLYEDLNGISSSIPQEEDPEQVQTALDQLELELQTIPTNYCQSYQRVQTINPHWVRGRDFRILFLRSTNFQPQQAAWKLVNHFHWKEKLFGPQLLGKECITLKDLNEEDINALRSGVYIYLPGRDRAGRKVLGLVPHWTTFRNQLRAIYYQTMNELREDVVMQKLGIVAISNLSEPPPKHRMREILEYIPFADSLPQRVVAVHVLQSTSHSPVTVGFLNTVHQVIEKQTRIRHRFYHGSLQEFHYALLGVGIQSITNQYDMDGNFRHHLGPSYLLAQQRKEEEDQLQQQQHQEQHQEQTMTMDVEQQEQPKQRQPQEHSVDVEQERQRQIPSPSSTSIMANAARNGGATGDNNGGIVVTAKDVLLGRGVIYQNHPGNLALNQMIAQHSKMHESLDNFRKTALTWQIVQTVQTQMGGRFLEQDPTKSYSKRSRKKMGGIWRTVHDETARRKVAKDFRNYREKHK